MEAKRGILVFVRTDVAPEAEEDFNRWYDEEHIPRLLKVPGVLWAKRGINTGAGPRYVAVYQHENIDVQKSRAYLEAVETEWTSRIRPHLKNFAREVYEIL